jgi:hypothetical protein
VNAWLVVSGTLGGEVGGSIGFFLQSEDVSKSIIANKYTKYFVIEIPFFFCLFIL